MATQQRGKPDTADNLIVWTGAEQGPLAADATGAISVTAAHSVRQVVDAAEAALRLGAATVHLHAVDDGIPIVVSAATVLTQLRKLTSLQRTATHTVPPGRGKPSPSSVLRITLLRH